MTNEATKLIAREPGIEMIEAGMREAYRASSLRTIWEAMYDAAPDLSQAPAAEAPTTFDCGCRWLENGEPAAICERHLRREQWIAERAAPSAAPAPTLEDKNWRWCTSRGYEVGEKCEDAAECAKNGCAKGRMLRAGICPDCNGSGCAACYAP